MTTKDWRHYIAFIYFRNEFGEPIFWEGAAYFYFSTTLMNHLKALRVLHNLRFTSICYMPCNVLNVLVTVIA